MSNYTLTINSSAAAREALADAGYNLVFAKGVSSGGDVDYNAAWITLKPSEITHSIKISWDVDYYANFTTSQVKDKAIITGIGKDIKMDAGGQYVVNATGSLIVDENHETQGSSFHFRNDQGYKLKYVPILESLDNNGNRVPIWAASTGVTKNGLIAATPIEVVRVWAGKYEQGQAFLAEYATQVIQFDLTTLRKGNATINDDLSGWNNFSQNAHTVDPNLNTNFVLEVTDTKLSDALNNLSEEIGVTLLVTFTTALTIAAVTYLTKQLMNKFSDKLRPSDITVSAPGGYKLEVKFQNTAKVLAILGMDIYETEVNRVLKLVESDSDSGLAGETWTIAEKQLAVHR
ncbi:hypothetical protein [Nostoc sp. C117]|uniref:hypothetical protein n=1 Tax=Nostoc sp. C117 TaxID=3349875 RepID=UPI00370D0D73